MAMTVMFDQWTFDFTPSPFKGEGWDGGNLFGVLAKLKVTNTVILFNFSTFYFGGYW